MLFRSHPGTLPGFVPYIVTPERGTVMLRIGSLFSGVGGLDMAVEAFFGAKTVWHCEVDPEPSKVLEVRWPGVPNLGDITRVDWSSVEPVDILCGGFPCQDLSLAGRRKGIRPGTRSGLWADFRDAIAALKPSVVVIENVRGLLSGCAESDSDVEPCPGCVGDGEHRPLVRALGRVLGDLAGLGFDAEWGSLPASAVGAPHGRFRVFVVAYAQDFRHERGWPARERGDELLLPGIAESLSLLPTPRASRGASSTETMYALGAERDDTEDRQGNVTGSVRWGTYEAAVRRWEALTRPAPSPTRPDGKGGRDRLNPELPEWMMGYPAGHVTDVLARNPAIKACGNGVVPQQAYAALDELWGRVLESIAV